jgi:cytochrome c biogenesis protein CcmG, thiol:disulfide interchange protein DsbE
MRRLALPLVLVALLCGCSSGDSTPPSAARPAADTQALAGAPAPLAALHAQANELLDGGTSAFKARLRDLRGYPVVVNKWGSWCGPCREELPYFQRESVAHGKRVGFLGVDAVDPEDGARKLMDRLPVSYPSYKDPEQRISAELNGVQATPVTAFYDAEGELVYTHQGGYPSRAKLAQDIRRYAR